jgi:hypothetical protein
LFPSLYIFFISEAAPLYEFYIFAPRKRIVGVAGKVARIKKTPKQENGAENVMDADRMGTA